MTSSKDRYHILLLEDNSARRAELEKLLTSAGYRVKATGSTEKALDFVRDGIDCVITGIISGDVSKIDVMKHWNHYFPKTPLPTIHETKSIDSLVEMVRLEGIEQTQDMEGAQLLLARLMQLVQACQKDNPPELFRESGGSRYGIIGHTPSMQKIFELIKRSAEVFSNVLILGESGTGKELVAQAIHKNSPRSAGPYIAMNCAAIPKALVESELFGYEKGAFTGASGSRIGRFEAADGGTLFIDEIGDCPLPIQAKLLRVLENRVITPLGGASRRKS